MEILTPTQKANRKYYARNAETIKAQKRASYVKSHAVKPVRQNQHVVKNIIESSEPVFKRVAVKAEDAATRTARRRIEDFKLAKELGIEDF